MTQGYKLGEFPCNQRANTDTYRGGHERSFGKKTKTYCPNCQVPVTETDSTCWRCKKGLDPQTLDRL
jgi:predicted amidophosphoribosyltransferase